MQFKYLRYVCLNFLNKYCCVVFFKEYYPDKMAFKVHILTASKGLIMSYVKVKRMALGKGSSFNWILNNRLLSSNKISDSSVFEIHITP